MLRIAARTADPSLCTTPPSSPKARTANAFTHEPVTDVRFDAPDHRRAAAVRDDGDPAAGAPVEDRGDILFGLGQRDEIRWLREVTAQSPHEIAVRLAVGVAGALVRVVCVERLER